MKLYEGWQSSASWRVRWALALKRVPYQRVLVDIAAGEHQRVLAGKNPMRAVPTLELDDGRILTESVAIIQWLDETHPEPPLLPADPLARARVRELVELVNAGIHPLQNTKVRAAISPDPARQAAWALGWIAEGLTACEVLVARHAGRFAAGDQLTMADLYLVPQAKNAERHGGDLSAWPRVRAVYAACMATPEARSTAPEAVRAGMPAAVRAG